MTYTEFLSSENPARSLVLRQAQAGCRESREQLFSAARAYLRSAARNAIDDDVRAHFSESDLVQETLLAAEKGFEAFEGTTQKQFHVWLRRILVNTLLNQYRAHRQTAKRDLSRERSLDSGQVAPEQMVSPPDESPSSLAMLREESALLASALRKLPEEYRRVLEMRHRHHCSFAEIGESLERSSDAARMLWYRAFQQLTATLAEMKSATRRQARLVREVDGKEEEQ